MGTTASPSHLLLLPQLPPSAPSAAPSHLSLSIRLHLPFPSAVQSHSSTSSFNASLPQPLPQPLPPSHLPSLSSCLFFPFLLFPPSLFLCSSVPLSSLPFWAFGRSFRNHILKRILDITNPHRTLTVCGWTSASFFNVFCSHGPQTALFLPGVRVRTMRTGMRFLAAPYWPHDTPCQHSSISTSVAHLWCSVVRHRHPGTGHVTLLCHVRRRLVFSGELHCSFTCAAMRCSSVLMLCRLPCL